MKRIIIDVIIPVPSSGSHRRQLNRSMDPGDQLRQRRRGGDPSAGQPGHYWSEEFGVWGEWRFTRVDTHVYWFLSHFLPTYSMVYVSGRLNWHCIRSVFGGEMLFDNQLTSSNSQMIFQSTGLHWAAQCDAPAVCLHLLAVRPSLIEERDHEGCQPLHLGNYIYWLLDDVQGSHT